MHSRNTVRILNGLIHTCRDGEALCRAFSEAARSHDVHALLRERATQWGKQADELQALVLALGGRPAQLRTLRGGLLEGWVRLKFAVMGRSDLPVVLEWEQTQRQSLRRYQRALAEQLSASVRRTLTLQASRISAHHHRLEDLRGYLAAHTH